MHHLTRNSDGGERKTIFRMIAEDVQGKVGALEFFASRLCTLSNISHRNKPKPLTYEVFHSLLTKHPPRIPPPGEQLGHPLELGPCRSQIEEMSPSRVTDLFRSLRGRFEANPTRHEFEELIEARSPFQGIESPT
jgi:hypothetical protein